MQKIRYETDPYNRLVVSGRQTGLDRHRRVVDGTFHAEKDNALTYHTKTPVEGGAASPYQVRLSGAWSLTKSHDLKFTVSAANNRPASGEIMLSGGILEAKGDSLIFSLTTKTGAGARKTYIMQLTGVWRADRNNRLVFSVKRHNGGTDALTFRASWSIGRNNELVYEYVRSAGARKAGASQRIAFKGSWAITKPAYLSYSIEGASNSSFDFRTAAGICGPRSMTFELGTGLSRHLRPSARTVVLYGSWKFTRSSGLNFEIEYAGGRRYSMKFAAEAKLTDDDRVTLCLKDPAGRKDLGLEVTLAHEILGGDGSAFLRLLKSSEESAVFIGSAFRW